MASLPATGPAQSVTLTPARGRDPSTGGHGSVARWDTIRYAIERWDRTLRLCLILFVASSIPPSVISLVVWCLLRRLSLLDTWPKHQRGQRPRRAESRPPSSHGGTGRYST